MWYPYFITNFNDNALRDIDQWGQSLTAVVSCNHGMKNPISCEPDDNFYLVFSDPVEMYICLNIMDSGLLCYNEIQIQTI